MINLLAVGVVLLGGLGLSLKRAALTLATAAIAVLAWHQFPSWDSLLLTSGPYIYAERYQRESEIKKIELEEAMTEGREVVFFEDGLHAAVSVERTDLGDLAIKVNGKTDATAKGDARTQLMVGHVPLLLHPDPKEVLVIGLGSGMTLGAVERYPVKAIEVVELEPAVVRASELFRPFTGDALNDRRVNLIVADGRNHLALSERQYDVIISQPSNPWVAGMANLFTREFFELSKKRLREGGVMCQWLHAYSMIPGDFKTIVATFQSVFPHMSLWEVKLGSDYLLIGSSEKLAIGYETLRSRLSEERMQADLKTMNLSDLPSLLARVLMEEEAAVEYAAGAPLHTDDNARLEYSAPRGFFKDEKKALVTEIYRHRSSPADVLRSFDWDELPSQVVAKHRRLFEARKDVLAGYLHALERDRPEAVKSLIRALALNPRDAEAVALLHKMYVEMGERFEMAEDHEKALEAYTKSVNVISRFASDDPELLRHQFEMNVVYGRTQLRLGMMSGSSNHLEKAARAIEISLQEGIETAEAHVNLGAIYGKIGKLEEALREYERALEMKPDYAVAHVNYANLCLRLGRYDEAIGSYHEALRLRPNYEMTHYNLGVAYFQRGEWARAAEEWRRALELKPNFPQARRSLDAALEKIKLEGGPN